MYLSNVINTQCQKRQRDNFAENRGGIYLKKAARRRILSFILTFVMVSGICGFYVHAENIVGSPPDDGLEAVALSLDSRTDSPDEPEPDSDSGDEDGLGSANGEDNHKPNPDGGEDDPLPDPDGGDEAPLPEPDNGDNIAPQAASDNSKGDHKPDHDEGDDEGSESVAAADSNKGFDYPGYIEGKSEVAIGQSIGLFSHLISTEHTWSSSDETIATVAADSSYKNTAIVTGVSKGTVTITHTGKYCWHGKEYSFSETKDITVSKYVGKVDHIDIRIANAKLNLTQITNDHNGNKISETSKSITGYVSKVESAAITSLSGNVINVCSFTKSGSYEFRGNNSFCISVNNIAKVTAKVDISYEDNGETVTVPNIEIVFSEADIIEAIENCDGFCPPSNTSGLDFSIDANESITGTQTLTSKLTVTKTFSGLSADELADILEDFTLTVTGTSSGNSSDKFIKSVSDASLSDGIYTWTFTDIKTGNYTVSESNYLNSALSEKYSHTATIYGVSATETEISVIEDETSTVAFVNSYTLIPPPPPDPTYTVKWVISGNEAETDLYVPCGTTPSYDGDPPSKTSDSSYTYSFAGWSDSADGSVLSELPKVTADVTYYAKFTSSPIIYPNPNPNPDPYPNPSPEPTEIIEESPPLDPSPYIEPVIEIPEDEVPEADKPVIPYPADPTTPQTGDNENLSLMLILAALSASGLGALGIACRRKKHTK